MAQAIFPLIDNPVSKNNACPNKAASSLSAYWLVGLGGNVGRGESLRISNRLVSDRVIPPTLISDKTEVTPASYDLPHPEHRISTKQRMAYVLLIEL